MRLLCVILLVVVAHSQVADSTSPESNNYSPQRPRRQSIFWNDTIRGPPRLEIPDQKFFPRPTVKPTTQRPNKPSKQIVDVLNMTTSSQVSPFDREKSFNSILEIIRMITEKQTKFHGSETGCQVEYPILELLMRYLESSRRLEVSPFDREKSFNAILEIIRKITETQPPYRDSEADCQDRNVILLMLMRYLESSQRLEFQGSQNDIQDNNRILEMLMKYLEIIQRPGFPGSQNDIQDKNRMLEMLMKYLEISRRSGDNYRSRDPRIDKIRQLILRLTQMHHPATYERNTRKITSFPRFLTYLVYERPTQRPTNSDRSLLYSFLMDIFDLADNVHKKFVRSSESILRDLLTLIYDVAVPGKNIPTSLYLAHQKLISNLLQLLPNLGHGPRQGFESAVSQIITYIWSLSERGYHTTSPEDIKLFKKIVELIKYLIKNRPMNFVFDPNVFYKSTINLVRKVTYIQEPFQGSTEGGSKDFNWIYYFPVEKVPLDDPARKTI